MSDTITKYNEQHFFFDEELTAKPKINQTLTKNQALLIINSLLLYCKDEESLLEDILELKNYIRNG